MSFAPLPSTESIRRRLVALWRLLTRYAVAAYLVALVGSLLGVPVVLVAEFRLELVAALRYTLAVAGVGYAGLMAVLFSDRLAPE
jgi:DMSO/TMAO reductase YedYZ heme-binding membrane subunit